MKDYFNRSAKTRFVFPINGDVVNCYDGKEENGKLYITVKVESDTEVTVNGKKAVKQGDYWCCEQEISYGENVLKAESDSGKAEVKVYRIKDVNGCYRLSSDDNIIFLYDINKNKDKYSSIFDNPYLAMYKKAHDLYGACVHLNIYYEMPPHPDFKEQREFFDLSMMTEKFKDEWKANSSWLKLNFHAKADKPDKPYIDTDYDRIYGDIKKIQKEIIRFAGEDTLSDETTVHWGACTEEGVRAVRDCGIKKLAGYFVLEAGRPVVSYYYPKDLVNYLTERDFWYDEDHDMTYAKIDNVLNLYSVDEINALMPVLYEKKTNSGFVEIMIHEEYFHPDYNRYIPDFEEHVYCACRFLKEHGYRGSFLRDAK